MQAAGQRIRSSGSGVWASLGPLDRHSEVELVTLAKAGDRAAFSELVHRNLHTFVPSGILGDFQHTGRGCGARHQTGWTGLITQTLIGLNDFMPAGRSQPEN